MISRVMLGVFLCLLPTVGWALPQGKHTYTAVNGIKGHKKLVNAAIEEAASKFNALIRGIARSRLRASNHH